MGDPVTHREDDRHGCVSARTAAEQAVTATLQHQLFDELDDHPGPRRALRVTVDQRRAKAVQLLHWDVQLLGEVDVINRKRVVGLCGYILDLDTSVL